MQTNITKPETNNSDLNCKNENGSQANEEHPSGGDTDKETLQVEDNVEKASDTSDLDVAIAASKCEQDVLSEETTFNELIEEDVLLQRQLMDARSELPIPTPETLTDDGTVEGSEEPGVVTVKFRTDNNETITSAFALHSPIGQAKERLANILKIHVEDIALSYQGNECDDLMILSGLGAQPLATIELGIHSTDPNKVVVLGDLCHYMPVVDVITVRVARRTGGFKDVVVEIENQCLAKEWLGGFRHRITKVEYHHAAVQTLPKKRPAASLPQFSRAVQTPRFPLKDMAVDTNQSITRGTQVVHLDNYIPNLSDRLVGADAERFQQKPTTRDSNLSQVVCVVSKVRKNLMEGVVARREQKERDLQSYEEEFRAEGKTKAAVFPLKRSDFYLLYLLVGKWWRKEMSRIARTKANEARAAALLDLLQREVALLSAIEQQRIQAKKVNWLRNNIRFLEMTARPVIFRNDRGVTTWIDTMETQQAREYQEIITSFMNTNVTSQQRIEVVDRLKSLIKSYGHYDLANEIVNLLERETQLLLLGMKNNQLSALRERVLQLLIDFFHRFINDTKTINLPRTTANKKKQPLHCCAHCNKLKPASDYNVHVTMTSFNTCRSCEWIKNIGNERIDLSPYSRLLSQVRQSEMNNSSYSSVCYLLQVVGMYYLVHHIWCCKSVLSDVDDMNELRMVRFRKEEDWSPWNCILLTVEESKAHLSIPDVSTFYGRPFLEQIRWKHQRAKNHFFPLLLNDKAIRDNNIWFDFRQSGTTIT